MRGQLRGRDNEFGIKLPTVDDWLEQDPIWGVFQQRSRTTGAFEPLSAEAWLEDMRSVTLSPSVPAEIRKMFEVARSCLIYGLLCYPLLTVGIQQMHRIMEAVLREKAKAEGVSLERRGYVHAIEQLNKHGVISGGDVSWWRNAARLRNFGAHPEMQTIFGPNEAISSLAITAEKINSLLA